MSTRTFSTSLTDSPRGPDLHSTGSSDNLSIASIADTGYRAIQELERVLFFTDLKDDADRQRAAQDGLDAIHRLDELLMVSKVDMKDKGSVVIKATPSYGDHDHDNVSTISSQYSESLIQPDTMNMMELLRAHFAAILASGDRAVREVERQVFFTDLDHDKLAQERSTHSTGIAASGDVWKEIEVTLQDMSTKLNKFQKQVHHQSHKAYKECERTLLFTDLDQVALAKDKTQHDVISHFLNTQQVGKELLDSKFRKNVFPSK